MYFLKSLLISIQIKIIIIKKLNMKGSLSLNPKFTPLGIKNARILRRTPLIACDDHHLYFKNSQTVKIVRWEDKNIVNCTYLNKYKIILLLCQNYRVYALTQNLQEICNISGWQSKYTLAFQVVQQFGIILLIGAETIQMIRISIVTNIKQTKFLSSIKFSLKHLSLTICPNQICKLSWNKGYHINIKQSLLLIWSPDSVAFYNLHNLQLKSESHCLTKKQHPITQVYFSSIYKYTVTGVSSGQIRVWRLPLSKKFAHQHVLIHLFQCHTKSISTIIQSNTDERIIISSSEDMQVCVWSLQTFQMLRKYEFLGLYSHIYLRSMQQAYVVKDSIIGLLNFGQSLSFITEIPSQIICIDKFYENQSCRQVALTMDSNLGMILKTEDLLNLKDLNKIQIKNIYPPLKAKAIKQIVSSPYTFNTYFLLVQNGQLFKITTSTQTSKISQVYYIERSTDRQKHQLNQTPTYIAFLPIMPMEFDSQIIDGSQKQKEGAIHFSKMSRFQVNQLFFQMRLIAIGCSKGSIIFVKSDNLQKIYSRLTYHLQKIIFFDTIKQFKDASQYDINHKNYIMVSCCAQKNLKLVRFNYQQSLCECYLTYYFGQQLKFFKTFDTFLAVVFYKGQFEITYLDYIGKNQEICYQNLKETENHDGEIIALDYQRNYELILTVASDNKIKIWTTKKIFIYQIVLDQGLSFCSFIYHFKKEQNKKLKGQRQMIEQQAQKSKQILMKRSLPVKFDLLIGHMGKLLCFRQIPLAFKQSQISEINNINFQQSEKYSIRQLIQSLQPKYQKSKSHIQKAKVNVIQDINYSSSKKVLNQKRNLKTQAFDNEQSYLMNSRISPKKVRQFQNGIKFDKQKPRYRIKTQQSPNSPMTYNNLSTKRTRPTTLKPIHSQYKSFSSKKETDYTSLIPTSSLQATKKHLAQLSVLKGLVNRPILPRIQFRTQQVFDKFMRDKLINKNILTRRDITLNRIIMKNIIKEHFEQDTKFSDLKLDF